ncbi:hypothetical protein BHYA_0101g00230 [Botrytis hyacinthi]|uniref:Uncharacterized protein n=1 Tax=Botrytis hyacinthi TaxID=278943 RepID=A0A4Z1GJX8_9HELO|nr:hypothetical protein BHYA_0101g00230 [Botrytis hyacinthi]
MHRNGIKLSKDSAQTKCEEAIILAVSAKSRRRFEIALIKFPYKFHIDKSPPKFDVFHRKSWLTFCKTLHVFFQVPTADQHQNDPNLGQMKQV